MDQTPSFQHLFNAALQEYQNQTGISLVDHPFAKQLQSCDSVDSITSILQEQAQIFRELRDDGKLMKSLEYSVNILYTLSIGTGGITLPPPSVNVIFAGIAILLAAVKDISSSYDALVDLLASFGTFLSRLGIYTRVPPTLAVTKVLVKIVVELLSTLALATKMIKQKRFKKLIKKLQGEDVIEATLQRLDRLTLEEARATAVQTFEVVYSLVQHRRVVMDGADGNESIAIILCALESIQEIVGNVNKAEREKVQRDVRNWLSPPDPWKNHNLTCQSRHSGSGKWWIKGEAYAEWKYSGPSSLLWINGKPGAGKSVICSTIIEDIRTLQKSGLASLAFFYCDFRDDQKKDQRGLLSSILVQLCGQSDSYSAILSDFYAAHGEGSQHASDSELLGCLKDMLKLPGQAPVYIIIDALDECLMTSRLPSPRDKVLELIEELVDLQIPNLRICVTSRPEADIVPVLEPLAFHSVSLHSERGQVEDIAEYINFVIQTSRETRKWRAIDKQLAIDDLIKKANGMFRWVFCQLVYLRGRLPGRIRRCLNESPETLDETYARILEEIDKNSWGYAHRLFQCVAVASRPLNVDELAEFLAFDFEAGSTPTFLADWRPEDPAHAVSSICSSLLAVVGLGDGSSVVQFAHFSVKEYLTSARLAEAKDTISRFHVSLTPAHTIVAQACLGVLLHLDEDVTKDSLENFPLAEYAAEHWAGHAQIEDVSSNVQDGMKRLFDPSKCHLSVWVWVCEPEYHWLRPQRSERPVKARATPLHYAAFCGMSDIATFLIAEHSQDVSARGFDKKETPLHVALRHGHVGVAQLLLEHHADAEAQDDDKCTPLLLASQCGHVEVARILLELGADTEARDYMKRVPLLLASEYGHVEVVRALLKHGADTGARDEGGWSPLELASFHGSVEVAQVLLEHGSDVNSHYRDNQTPLHFAQGQEVTQLLLKYGADADALDTKGRTPLHQVSEHGDVGAVRALLEHGIDANARDANDATPLHLASHGGYSDVVRLLLQYSSDIHARDDRGRTPFMGTTDHIMQLLSEYGAEDHRI